jgi:hypothetical protein
MNGKGSARRPASISSAQFKKNWERIFKQPGKVANEKVSQSKSL